VDQATDRQQLLDLAALQVADEVPLEGVAPALVLGDQVLLAVLTDEANAGLCQRPHLLHRHVLTGGEDLDPGPGELASLGQVGGDLLGLKPVDQARHDQPSPGLRQTKPA